MSMAQSQTQREGMKLIIIDFIKRWKWVLGPMMALPLFYTAAALLEVETSFFTGILAVIAPTLVSLDLQRGTAKVHSLLPVPRRTLANSYWAQAVLLPIVVAFGGMLIASVVIGTFKTSAFGSLGSLPHVTVLSFALSGTLYFIVTFMFMPLGSQPGLWKKILAGITVASWGLIFSLGMLLTTAETIPQWSTMAANKKSLLVAGIVLGIASFFTSRRLVRYWPALRPGVHPRRERTPARWIVFPNRTASLLEPWFFTILFSLLAFLIPAGLVLSLFTFTTFIDGGDIREVVAMILDSPGRLWVYGLPLLIVFAFIAGIRSIWSLRMIRTLPLSGWRLTGMVVSLSMLVWYIAWLTTFVFLLVTGRLGALFGLTRLMFFITGLVILTIGLLVRFGPRPIVVALAVMFPLIILAAFTLPAPSFLAGVAILVLPVAIIGLLFSALGIWITHRAITACSQSYRPSNFMGPGGVGR